VANRPQKRFGPFIFDGAERSMRRDGQVVPLTPKAFDLLAAFVEQPGRLLSKDELLKKVWPDTFVEESNLAYHVFVVRKALGEPTENSTYIETVPKRGYRFTAPVVDESVEAGDARPASAEAPAVAASLPPIPDRSTSQATAFSFPRRLGIVAIVLLPAILLYIGAWSRRAPPDTEPLRALPIAPLPGVVSAPTLSPDAKFVVFVWRGNNQDHNDLYLHQVGTGGPHRLTTDPGNDHSPSWSPDGQTIAFLRRPPNGDRSEVFLIAPLGGTEHKLTDLRLSLPAYASLSIDWCPDSRCLLVTDSQGKEVGAIYVVARDTGEKRQLTHPVGLAMDVHPAISPDGRTLVFRRNTNPFTGEYYRLSLGEGMVPAGEPVRLATAAQSGGKLDWLPGGSEILFAARGGLWRLDALSGGTPRRVPYVGQDGINPVVSRMPDGRQRLVYVRSFWDHNIWRQDLPAPGAPVGTAPASAVSSPRVEYVPSLSPDGRRIAFVSDRLGDLQLWVADGDGANATQLTSLPFSGSPGYPRWSPDGETIVFHGDFAGQPDVIAVPVKGGKPTILSEGGYPSFSRDGKWVYFCVVKKDPPYDRRIWKIPTGGGSRVQVTHVESALAIESPDGRDLYYLDKPQHPSSELWRMPLGGGTATKVLEGVLTGNVDIADNGIYFLERVSPASGALYGDRPGESRLQYFDFATRRVATVASNLGWVAFGLTTSRDGRSVFFARTDSSINELMVVDGFN
jgi:Tol biopolymer transport system component/DNA-binding winged helix-turn-helix (wHTH) protein